MKNHIFFVALILFGCADSEEKKELDKLRDSIRIIKSLRNAEAINNDPSVFNPAAFNAENGVVSDGDRAKMERAAKGTADSLEASNENNE